MGSNRSEVCNSGVALNDPRRRFASATSAPQRVSSSRVARRSMTKKMLELAEIISEGQRVSPNTIRSCTFIHWFLGPHPQERCSGLLRKPCGVGVGEGSSLLARKP